PQAITQSHTGNRSPQSGQSSSASIGVALAGHRPGGRLESPPSATARWYAAQHSSGVTWRKTMGWSSGSWLIGETLPLSTLPGRISTNQENRMDRTGDRAGQRRAGASPESTTTGGGRRAGSLAAGGHPRTFHVRSARERRAPTVRGPGEGDQELAVAGHSHSRSFAAMPRSVVLPLVLSRSFGYPAGAPVDPPASDGPR